MSYIELGDICDVVKGEIGITKAVPGEFPMVTTGEKRSSHNKFQLDTEAVLVPLVSATGHGHASIKRVHYQEGKFAFGSILAACVPKNEQYSARFLHIYLQLMKDYVLVPLMKGSANVSLTLGNLKTAKVPNISRERQESIVSLYELIKVEQDQVINELDVQNRDITSLREAILQEAVQGKLTAQWRKENPTSEPASELLKRIEAEKQQLIDDKKIKKEKSLPPIEDEDKPYDLPEGWEWCRPASVALNIVDCPHSTAKFTSEGKACIDTTCMDDNGGLKYDKIRKVSDETFDSRNDRLVPKAGDLIYAREGSIGKSVIIPEGLDVCLGQRVMIYRLHSYINPYLFRYMLVSPMFMKQVLSNHKGLGAKHVNMSDLRSMPVPIIPKEEQEVLLEKINSLMTLCDELEQQIDNCQTQIEQLMQSCLKEVFEK